MKSIIANILVILAINVVFFSPLSMAQSRTGTGLGGDVERLMSSDISTSSAGNQQPSGFATDSPIHPDYYFVGAGDVMTLEIVGPVSLTVPIVVSPENTILLPRFGEIVGAGKTLTQVRNEIQRLVQNRNPNNRAFLTLQRARSVYVRITGNVAQAGVYTLPASLRVSTAVQIANQEIAQTGTSARTMGGERKNTGIANEISPNGQYSIPFAQRNIKILHREGATAVADAVRSRMMNDASADPCLREGDEIYVPFEHEAGETVSIAGAVQRPCLMPFRKGDKISLLLKASYGLTENADSTAIQVTEAFSVGSSAGSAQTLTLGEILSGTRDIALQGGMSVVVRSNAQATKRRGTVSVIGEVNNPGVFALNESGSRIKSILQQAGGLTTNAHPGLSQIIRRDNKALMLSSGNTAFGTANATDALKNLQYTTLTPEDTAAYKAQETLRRPVVACDLQALLEKNSETDNILLQDGDVIVIAANPRNVYVFGHVQKPGFVEFSPERDADFYIQATGGFAANADSARTRIIKGKNRLWLEPRINTGVRKGTTTFLEAGDQIFVPRTPDTNTDLALKRVSADLQKQSLELQQQNQLFQTIIGIVSVLFAGVNTYLLITKQ